MKNRLIELFIETKNNGKKLLIVDLHVMLKIYTNDCMLKKLLNGLKN